MDTNETTEEAVIEEVVEEAAPAETTEETTETAKVEKPRETLEQKEARLARELKQTQKKLGKVVDEPAPKTGVLDDNALYYLDLKDVTEAEDIKVIKDVISKTGLSVREALKDDYVSAKLAANKEAREVKAATPSSTKRAGEPTGDSLAAAIAKFEQSNVLPEDFATRSAVINAMVEKSAGTKPIWQR